MAKKFIDAEETLKQLQDLCSDGNMYGDENLTLVDFAQVEETILDMPAADVQEVRRGRWEIDCNWYYLYCSECKEKSDSDVMSNYCPNCGARMD